jgi:hypothetical protein
MLQWPEYNPPIWWPYQPITGLELFDSEIERERLNVTYLEDIKYLHVPQLQTTDVNVNENVNEDQTNMNVEQNIDEYYQRMRQIKDEQIEDIFVHDSEILERRQLDNPAKNWFF